MKETSQKHLRVKLVDASWRDLQVASEICNEHNLRPRVTAEGLEQWLELDRERRFIKVAIPTFDDKPLACQVFEARWNQKLQQFVVHIIRYAARKSYCDKGVHIPHIEALLQDRADAPKHPLWHKIRHLEIHLRSSNTAGQTFLRQLDFYQCEVLKGEIEMYEDGEQALFFRHSFTGHTSK